MLLLSYVGQVEKEADRALISKPLVVEWRSNKKVVKTVIVDIHRAQRRAEIRPVLDNKKSQSNLGRAASPPFTADNNYATKFHWLK